MAGDSENLMENIMNMLGDNPQEKISQLLGSLTAGEKTLPTVTEKSSDSESTADLSALLSIGSALSSGNIEDDNTRLLLAIKPFLNDKRKPQLDSLLKILKLKNVAEKAGGMDILKNLKL